MYTLSVDHSFHIGSQHLKNGMPCQDYALSGFLDNKLAYAVVSDGCSSGGMTDIGARLTALATKRALEEFPKQEIFPKREDQVIAINNLRDSYLEAYRVSLRLEYRDLLATCLFAVVSDEQVFVHAVGDGAIGYQYEGELEIESFHWDQNTPYYPAYALGGHMEAFKKVHEGNTEPFTYIVEGTSPTGMGGIPDGLLSTNPLSEGVRGWSSIRHIDNEEYGQLQSIALFSDGVEQVGELSYQDVVTELQAFKSTNGKFAVRRMNRFLKDAATEGNIPVDDIAYAVIAIANVTETET